MTIFSPQWMISAFFHLRKKPDFFRGCRQLFPKSVNICFTIDGKSKIILVGIHALYVNTNSIWCVQVYIKMWNPMKLRDALNGTYPIWIWRPFCLFWLLVNQWEILKPPSQPIKIRYYLKNGAKFKWDKSHL